MSTRLFEGKQHASYYQKFRVEPSQEILELISSFLDERLPKPHGLAVDVGCGTGQSTRILSTLFKEVLGTDVSEAQIEEAKKVELGPPNVTYSACPAEEVPVDDASVDLLTACAAVHWFTIDKFLKEVDRILKPRGCLAFYSYLPHMEVHYKDRSEQMTQLISEVEDILAPYQHEKVRHVKTGYKEIFEAIPYTDKKRIESVITKITMPLAGLIGLIQTFSMFQTFLKSKPEKAKEMITSVEQRFLRVMETSSSDTEIEVWFHNILVLASKPQ